MSIVIDDIKFKNKIINKISNDSNNFEENNEISKTKIDETDNMNTTINKNEIISSYNIDFITSNNKELDIEINKIQSINSENTHNLNQLYS